MKSFLKGFAAAILGSAIFMGSIIGWAKLTDAGTNDTALSDSAANASYDALIAERLAMLDLADGTGTFLADSSNTDSASAVTATGSSANSASSISGGTTAVSGGSSSGTGASSNSTGAASTGNSGGSSSSTGNTASTGALPAAPANGNFDGAVDASKAPAEYAQYMQKIESELKPTYGDCLRVEYLNKQIIVSVWENGLVDRLTKGQTNGTTKTIWNSMKVALSDISTTYSNGLVKAELEGSRVHAHLLNEKNLNKIILAYTDGKLVHDGLDHE